MIVEFMGVPGSGKSTLAADLFVALKRQSVNCELVREVAKELCWAGMLPKTDQGYILELQRRKYLEVLGGGCDVIVSDTSLILSSFYNGLAPGWIWEHAYLEKPFVFYVNRTKPYNPRGRRQSEAESDALAERMRALAVEYGFDQVNSDTPAQTLVERLGQRQWGKV